MSLTDLLIAGGVAAGFIKILDGVIQFALGRWGKKKDKKDDQACATEDSIKALKTGQKVILLDRILYLGRAYIHDREVDADDLRRLNAMHEAYHELGGNGDAKALMARVNALPLK